LSPAHNYSNFYQNKVEIGDDKIEIVRNYIANQVEHHKKISFAMEYEKFIERYGFNIVKK